MAMHPLSQIDRDMFSASQLIRAGFDPVDPKASDELRKQQTRAAELAEPFADRKMIEILQELTRRCGEEVRGNAQDVVRAAFSTGEASGIFNNIANASLTKAFQEYPDSTDWCRETLVSDYKTHETYRLAAMGNVPQLPRGGTADHAFISDITESYKIARYAQQFVIDEMDIIDDSAFGALEQIPAMMGQACARIRADLAYSELLANAALGADGVALFHNDHSNLATGGSSALDADSLAAGIVAMATQTEGAARLNLRPAFLVVPQQLFFTALVLEPIPEPL